MFYLSNTALTSKEKSFWDFFTKVVKIKFFHGPALAILLFYQYENEFREIYIHANATQLDIWCYI